MGAAKALAQRSLRALGTDHLFQVMVQRLLSSSLYVDAASTFIWPDSKEGASERRHLLERHRALIDLAADPVAAERAVVEWMQQLAAHPDRGVYERAITTGVDRRRQMRLVAGELAALLKPCATRAAAETRVASWMDALPRSHTALAAEVTALVAAKALSLAVYTNVRDAAVPSFQAAGLYMHLCGRVAEGAQQLLALPARWAATRALARLHAASSAYDVVALATNIARPNSRPLWLRQLYRVAATHEPFATGLPYERDVLEAPELAPLLQSSADFERGCPRGLSFVLTPVRDAQTCTRLRLLERALLQWDSPSDSTTTTAAPSSSAATRPPAAPVAATTTAKTPAAATATEDAEESDASFCYPPSEWMADVQALEDLCGVVACRRVLYRAPRGVAGPGPDASLVDRACAALEKLKRLPRVASADERTPHRESDPSPLGAPAAEALADGAAFTLARRAVAALNVGVNVDTLRHLCADLHATTAIRCTFHGGWTHGYYRAGNPADNVQVYRRLEEALADPRRRLDPTALAATILLGVGWPPEAQTFRELAARVVEYAGFDCAASPHLHAVLHL